MFFWTHILGGVLLREGKMSGPVINEVTGARGANVRMALPELAGTKIELLLTITLSIQKCLQHPIYQATLTLLLHDTLLNKESAYGWKTPGKPQTISSGALQGTRVVYLQSPDGHTLELMELSP